MLSAVPATNASCLAPARVLTFSAINGGNSECISWGSLSSWSFQRIFRSLTLSLVRIFSSFCQAVRWGLAPSVNQSALQRDRHPSVAAIPIRNILILRSFGPAGQPPAPEVNRLNQTGRKCVIACGRHAASRSRGEDSQCRTRATHQTPEIAERSEERRVGKECRS